MAKAKSSKKWIQGAIKEPGSLTKTAKKAGAVKEEGTIKEAWLREQAAKGNTTTARRARLALTLKKMSKGKK